MRTTKEILEYSPSGSGDVMSPYYDNTLELGRRLADLPIEKGGWKEFFENVQDIEAMCRRPGFTVKPEEVVSMTAILMENERRNLRAVNEDVRAIQVGGFQDMVFPIIRAAFPANPIMDMVSVQTLTRKHGQVFFMNYVIGQTKGQYAAGARMFDWASGYAGGHHYSDEYVEREAIGTISGVNASGTCQYNGSATGYSQGGGIRPGSVYIQLVASNGTDINEIRDNGAGRLVLASANGSGDTLSTGVIDYVTGVYSLAMTGGQNIGSSTGYISYEYDSEGSANLPTIDVQLVNSPIVAKRRALRYRYSTESQQDFQAEFGRDISEEIAAGIAATIVTEQAREVLMDLWLAAGAPFQTFSTAFDVTTAHISRNEFMGDIRYPLTQTIQQMYQETQRQRANWMVVDTAMATWLLTLGAPYFLAFDKAPINDDELGIKFIGMWDGRVRVYMDSLLNTYPGASQFGNALLGYKGNDFREVAYIWAPYRLMYMTPATTLDDFMTRKAMASRVGRKVVNPRLVKRFALVA